MLPISPGSAVFAISALFLAALPSGVKARAMPFAFDAGIEIPPNAFAWHGPVSPTKNMTLVGRDIQDIAQQLHDMDAHDAFFSNAEAAAQLRRDTDDLSNHDEHFKIDCAEMVGVRPAEYVPIRKGIDYLYRQRGICWVGPAEGRISCGDNSGIYVRSPDGKRRWNKCSEWGRWTWKSFEPCGVWKPDGRGNSVMTGKEKWWAVINIDDEYECILHGDRC